MKTHLEETIASIYSLVLCFQSIVPRPKERARQAETRFVLAMGYNNHLAVTYTQRCFLGGAKHEENLSLQEHLATECTPKENGHRSAQEARLDVENTTVAGPQPVS